MQILGAELASLLDRLALPAAAVAIIGLLVLLRRARRSPMALVQRAVHALLEGRPRRSRAFCRIAARRCPAAALPLIRIAEANGLIWEGRFDDAIRFIDSHAGGDGNRQVVLLLLRIEALLFDGRWQEARTLFEENRRPLERAGASRDLCAIEGIIAFHEGDLDSATDRLVSVGESRRFIDPIVHAAVFYRAAIAHRQRTRDETRVLLKGIIANGAGLFVARWALSQWSDLFPTEAPPLATTNRLWSRVLGLLGIFGIPLLRSRLPSFSPRAIVLLALLDVTLLIAMRLVDAPRDAVIYWPGFVTAVAPVVFFALTPISAALGRRSAPITTLAGGFLAAMPLFLIAFYVASRLRWTHERISLGIEIIAGAWALAVVVRLLRSERMGLRAQRMAMCSVVFVLTWLLPLHATMGSMLFIPRFDPTAREIGSEERNEVAFKQAEALLRMEAALSPERPGVPDLYFVGAAGYAHQDVFLHEANAARELFDERFDTRTRSLLLANDPTARERLPSVANATLRHALDAVAARMNLEEDVLFLFVTSHGSREGLALTFHESSSYDDETLRPHALRSMLDDAGIKWRVLVLSGCESGTFIGPLRTDHTLMVTAAAIDRNSYGCAMGNAYTDFGRALFAEQLTRERSFSTAFAAATDQVTRRETTDGLLNSRPQIYEGPAIGAKLRELEARLQNPSRSGPVVSDGH